MSNEQQGYKYPTPGLSDEWFSDVEAKVDRAFSQMITDATTDPLVTRPAISPWLDAQTALGSPFQLDEALPLDWTQHTTLWPTTTYYPTMAQALTPGPHLWTTAAAGYSPTTSFHSPATAAYSPLFIHQDDILFPLDNGQSVNSYFFFPQEAPQGPDPSVPASDPAGSSTAQPARAIAGTARMQRATLGSAGSAPHAQNNTKTLPPAVPNPQAPSALEIVVGKYQPHEPRNIGCAATNTAEYPGADAQHRGVFVVDRKKLKKDWENTAVTKKRSETHTVECAICRKAGLPRWFRNEAKMRRHRDQHYRAACVFCGRVMTARTDIYTSHRKDGRCVVHGELGAVDGAVSAWLERHQLSGHW